MKISQLLFFATIGLLFASCGGNNATTKVLQKEQNITNEPNQTVAKNELLDPLYSGFGVGYGASGAFEFHPNEWFNSVDLMFGNYDDVKETITDFNQTKFTQLSSYLKNSKYFVMWLTKDWQENWFDMEKINYAIAQGKVPLFIYWYFGDELINGFSQSDRDAYLNDVKRLNTLLSQVDGLHLLILEPEFNKDIILNSSDNREKFITTLSKAIDLLQNSDRKISLSMMDRGRRDENEQSDCGYTNCSYGDKYAWQEVDSIYKPLIEKLDFLSFNQMVSQFSRDPANPGGWDTPHPISYSDAQIGIKNLAQRVDNLALYLKEKYHKPIFLPYIAIATATWSDKNSNTSIESDEINSSGWLYEASSVYSQLHSKNLFGYCVMELFDNPTHDQGGYQFFMENEYHLGVVTSDMNDSKLNGNIRFKGEIVRSIFKKDTTDE